MEGAQHISEVALNGYLKYVFALGKKVGKVELVGLPEDVAGLLAVYLDARYVRAKLGEFNAPPCRFLGREGNGLLKGHTARKEGVALLCYSAVRNGFILLLTKSSVVNSL